jgi:hypothetical protein
MSFLINFSQTPTQTLGGNQVYRNNNCGNQTKPQLNANEIAKEFCNIYYSNTTKGLSNVLPLFDQSASCNYCGNECIGMYNVMVTMASEGISSMRYDKLNGVVLPINSNSISVQIIGLCQGVTFWGQLTPIKQFSETFVLTLAENRIIVTSYCFRLV